MIRVLYILNKFLSKAAPPQLSFSTFYFKFAKKFKILMFTSCLFPCDWMPGRLPTWMDYMTHGCSVCERRRLGNARWLTMKINIFVNKLCVSSIYLTPSSSHHYSQQQEEKCRDEEGREINKYLEIYTILRERERWVRRNKQIVYYKESFKINTWVERSKPFFRERKEKNK